MSNNRLRNSIRDRKPLAWAVFCPPCHAFEYLTFADIQEARHQAWEFADESGDDNWQIFPLFAGESFEA